MIDTVQVKVDLLARAMAAAERADPCDTDLLDELAQCLPKPDPDAEAREVLAKAVGVALNNGWADCIRDGDHKHWNAAVVYIRYALDKARAEKPMMSEEVRAALSTLGRWTAPGLAPDLAPVFTTLRSAFED